MAIEVRFSRNQDTQNDPELLIFFSQTARVFKLFSMWSDDKSLNTVKRTKAGSIVITFCSLFMVIIVGSGIFELRSKGDHIKSLMLLICFFAIIFGALKMFQIWNSVHEIKQCFRSLQNMACKFENQSYILRALKIYRTLFTLGLVITNITIFCFFNIPTFESNRTLPFDLKNPVDIVDLMKSPFYEIIYTYQIIGCSILANSIIACDTMFCGVMAIVTAILDSINNAFVNAFIENGTQNSSEKEKLKVFSEIIGDFIEICRIVDFITSIFSLISLTQVMLNTGLLGLALYVVSVLKLDNIIAVVMFASIFLQIFQLGIYCYFGEEVVQQTRKFRESLYECDWYNQSKSFKLMILLSLQKLQNEPFIAAGKVIPLCLATFAEVIKKAATAYAFLHNVKNA